MKPQKICKPQNRRHRIEPLEVLPVFLDLRGKQAVVVGISDGALWKAELLLQSGAQVKLVCTAPTAEVFALTMQSWPGQLELCVQPWQFVNLAGAALVLGDVEDAEAAEFHAKAKAAGTLVNLIDKPQFCDVQFGSIVNKSPLVIGISTGGAAPVLAQMVRGLIESSLPDGLQALAIKAKRIRARANGVLREPGTRRNYWNSFFYKCFGAAAHQGSAAPYRIAKSSVDDLTLRDIRALRQADAIYFARGANLSVSAFARREARQLHDCPTETLTNLRVGAVIVGLPENATPVEFQS